MKTTTSEPVRPHQTMTLQAKPIAVMDKNYMSLETLLAFECLIVPR